MTINLAVGPVVALIAGVLILLVPRLLNYIVAIYLIVIGLIGIFGGNGTHLRATATDRGLIPAAPVIAVAMAPAAPVIRPRASLTGKESVDDSQA